MANCVIITSRCASQNVDAYNRKAINTSANINNGQALNLAFPSSGEAFTATVPSSDFANVWIAVAPEVNKLVVGEVWGGLDPRNFTNKKGIPFDVIKPVKGDIILVSKDFFVTDKDPDTVSTATLVELTSSGWESKASATSQYAGITLKIGRKDSITIANTGIGSEQIDAWFLEVQ